MLCPCNRRERFAVVRGLHEAALGRIWHCRAPDCTDVTCIWNPQSQNDSKLCLSKLCMFRERDITPTMFFIRNKEMFPLKINLQHHHIRHICTLLKLKESKCVAEHKTRPFLLLLFLSTLKHMWDSDASPGLQCQTPVLCLPAAYPNLPMTSVENNNGALCGRGGTSPVNGIQFIMFPSKEFG